MKPSLHLNRYLVPCDTCMTTDIMPCSAALISSKSALLFVMCVAVGENKQCTHKNTALPLEYSLLLLDAVHKSTFLFIVVKAWWAAETDY